MEASRSIYLARLFSNMHVLGIHSMAQRLELTFKDAVKSCSVAKMVEDVLLGLHTI